MLCTILTNYTFVAGNIEKKINITIKKTECVRENLDSVLSYETGNDVYIMLTTESQAFSYAISLISVSRSHTGEPPDTSSRARSRARALYPLMWMHIYVFCYA